MNISDIKNIVTVDIEGQPQITQAKARERKRSVTLLHGTLLDYMSNQDAIMWFLVPDYVLNNESLDTPTQVIRAGNAQLLIDRINEINPE